MMASYFKDRILLVKEKEEMPVTYGVPQGLVLGPTLWNVYYDGVLKIPVPKSVTLLDYADDLGVMAEIREAEMMEVVTNRALHNVTEWMQSKQIKRVLQETEVVLLVEGRKTKNIKVVIEDNAIQSKAQIRYLSAHIDRNITTGTHIQRTAEKANKVLNNINRLMPKIQGLREASRRILCSVVLSIMLYGASIWKREMEIRLTKVYSLVSN